MYIPQKGQGLTHAGADVGFRASISTSRMSLVCLFLTVVAVSSSVSGLYRLQTHTRRPRQSAYRLPSSLPASSSATKPRTQIINYREPERVRVSAMPRIEPITVVSQRSSEEIELI